MSSITSGLVAAQQGTGLLVFHQGSGQNGQLWVTYSPDGTNWQQDGQVPNVGMSFSPSAIVGPNGVAYVFHQGSSHDGFGWYTYYNGQSGSWTTDSKIAIEVYDSPSAVLAPSGELFVFFQLSQIPFGPGSGAGGAGTLLYRRYDGTNWMPPDGKTVAVQNLGMSASASAVVVGPDIWVFHQGASDNGQLWYSPFNGKQWEPDTRVPNVGMSASPSAVVGPNGVVYVFHQGSGENGQLWYTYCANGTNWTPDTQVLGTDASGFTTNIAMSESPSAVLAPNGLIYIFHQGSGEDGQLWYTTYSAGSGNFTPDTRVPNVGMSASPSAVVW